MFPETVDAMDAGVFTVENYYFNGVGHISVDYVKVLKKGFKGICEEVAQALIMLDKGDPEAVKKSHFYEALQSFWFVQAAIQIESNGHSISPMRFDQYIYPYYEADVIRGNLSQKEAQELLDCLWVKFNDVNKVRDEGSTKSFGGYPMFQNLIVGG